MDSYVLEFKKIDKTKLAIAGGKGASLGELSGVEGINVPEGLCVSAQAYKRIIQGNQELTDLLEQLVLLQASEQENISRISAKIRQVIEETVIPSRNRRANR